jgi:RNA polymerase sigma factor (TIGR02999 family)
LGDVGSLNQLSPDITLLLHQWSGGDACALERLVPLIIRELHDIAERVLSNQSPDRTLQPTALVNELFLRLLPQHSPHWENRTHFFATAAKVMRQVLVDYARRRSAIKRGRGGLPIEVVDIIDPSQHSILDVIAVDEALTGLAAVDEYLANLVELRYFLGFSIQEAAIALDVAESTVKRDWNLAKAWLLCRLA